MTEHYQIALEEIKKRSLRVTPDGFFDGQGQNITLYNGEVPYITRNRKKVYLTEIYKYLLGKTSNDKARSKACRYVADFECTTDENNCFVWAWSLQNIDDPNAYLYGTSIDEFIETIKKIKHGSIYFHNFGKWDIEFILPHIMKTYKHVRHRKDKDEGKFATHIVETDVYTMAYVLGKSKANNRRISEITFIDSMKKLKMSVAKLGETYRKEIIEMYGVDLGKLTKNDEFFKRERVEGHILDDEEIDYVLQDSRIVAAALKAQFDMGLTRNTLPSDAMYDYKTTIPRKGEESPEQAFRRLYPKLSRDKSEFILWSYKGGLTQVKREHKAKDIGEGRSYDVNSTYSYQMKNQLLPFGEPLHFNGCYDDLPEEDKRDYPLYIQSFRAEAFLKDGCIPTIPKSMVLKLFGAEYWIDTEHPENFCMTNIDLERARENYDLEVHEYYEGLAFQGKVGLFDEYIDKWMKVKQENEKNKGKRQIAKDMLTNLYGKFAESWERNIRYPKFDLKGIVRYKPYMRYEELEDTPEDNQLKDELHDEQIIYPAMSSFITAYAREYLIQAIQDNYERALYWDTDSLFLKGYEPAVGIDIDLDENGEATGELGKWKEEYFFKKARFIRAKTYGTYGRKKGESTDYDRWVVAGIHKDGKKNFTWDTFYVWDGKYPNGHEGMPDVENGEVLVGKGVVWGDKTRKKVVNGVILEDGWGKILPRVGD